ncbi:cytochrome b ascorbate-dependent protein 3-like [Larimichthys crocea]|uniref:cytochrome b ascorbate-dependent protein 3-like n=1 Tax=Larimichthys crocea TaxID=215358 RepID=UPI000F5FD5CC|nr:cytochrome b ascorbate-dependent protein 3-like [Larimichthys crocea]
MFCLTYVLCLCLLCLRFVTSQWRGGFSREGSGLQFIWHPVLMVSGLLVLYGNVVTWMQKKHIWKLLGLFAVFDFHIPDLYSLHSWVGICTVVLFTFQVLQFLVTVPDVQV